MANRVLVADPADDEFAVRVIATTDVAVAAVEDGSEVIVAVTPVTMPMASMPVPVPVPVISMPMGTGAMG